MRPAREPLRRWGFRLALGLAVGLSAVALFLVVQRPGGAPGPAPVLPGSPTAAASLPTPPGTAAPTGIAGAPLASPTATAYVQVPGGKMRGVDIPVWGPDFVVADPEVRGAPALGANWVSLVSHWYVSTAAPITDGHIFRETGAAGTGAQRTASDASLAEAIDTAHALGLKVMLKPHVDWTVPGGWRGYFYFDDAKGPDGRQEWWSSYHDMISATVQLALIHHVEAICIGTEFDDINKEPASAAEWIHIIQQIRAAGYQGQLTYAANWGIGADAEYNRPGLQGVWEQLDFIGVDAYYPLSDAQDPTVAELVQGWHTPLNQWDEGPYAQLEELHARTGKPIVFTEVGYPATDYGAKAPASDSPGPLNTALQTHAAQALYQVWQDVDWWGGAFWWQDGPSYNRFSIQGRPITDALRQLWTMQAQR